MKKNKMIYGVVDSEDKIVCRFFSKAKAKTFIKENNIIGTIIILGEIK